MPKLSDSRMIGKRVRFDEQTWAVVNLLRQERRRSFQQLADEAFADLLEKHGHPVGLRAQLKQSAGKARRPKAPDNDNTQD